VQEVPPGPPEQVRRLERYRQEHPDVRMAHSSFLLPEGRVSRNTPGVSFSHSRLAEPDQKRTTAALLPVGATSEENTGAISGCYGQGARQGRTSRIRGGADTSWGKLSLMRGTSQGCEAALPVGIRMLCSGAPAQLVGGLPAPNVIRPPRRLSEKVAGLTAAAW
jgi:hypothetical protein